MKFTLRVFFVGLCLISARFAHAAPIEPAKLDRVLQLNYRTESYLEEFEGQLDQMLALQKAGGAHGRVLSMPAYQKMHELEALEHAASETVVQSYKQNLAILNERSVAPEVAANARIALEQMRGWFAGLSELDQIQLLELNEDLAKARGPLEDKTLDVLAPLAKLGSRDIEAKIRAHGDELRAKAKAARAVHDSELDAIEALPGYAAPEEPVAVASGPILFPSTGTNGNTDGHQLPAGTFVWTFDDGPHPTLTPKVLDLLKNYHDSVNKSATATFFRITENVIANPTTIALEKSYGYHMNSHSWTHPMFADLAKAGNFTALHHEVVDPTAELEKDFGYKFRFYRCPGGACFAPKIPQVRQWIADQGFIHAYWLIDTMDWAMKNQAQRVADGAIKEMQLEKRGVILIHDIHAWSVDAAGIVFDWIKNFNDSPPKAAVPFNKIRLMDLETAVDQINR